MAKVYKITIVFLLLVVDIRFNIKFYVKSRVRIGSFVHDISFLEIDKKFHRASSTANLLIQKSQRRANCNLSVTINAVYIHTLY